MQFNPAVNFFCASPHSSPHSLARKSCPSISFFGLRVDAKYSRCKGITYGSYAGQCNHLFSRCSLTCMLKYISERWNINTRLGLPLQIKSAKFHLKLNHLFQSLPSSGIAIADGPRMGFGMVFSMAASLGS